jgi:hypothetical protein
MKIALCGSAPSSRLLAPFGDVSWELWACSPQNYDYPRVDAWFEVHSLDRKYVAANKPYYDKLKAHPRVYISAPDHRLPNGIVLDPQPLIDRFGPYFWTSSLAWMMAMAIEQKPEVIGIWGVDMSANDELYSGQRAGMHYFMQKAVEAGIEVALPPQCDLAQAPALYGWREHWPMYWKMKESKKELEDRINADVKQEKMLKERRLTLQGAREYAEYVTNTWLTDTRGVPMPPLELGKSDEAV